MNSEELDTALGLGFAIAETSLLLLLLDEVDIDIVEERPGVPGAHCASSLVLLVWVDKRRGKEEK